MKRRLRAAAFLLLALVVRPADARAEGPLEDVRIAERLAHRRIPGASVALFEGGEIVWARGFGLASVERREKVTEATLFQAASISKPVAALLALKLVEDGKLGLDDDVNEALRSWKVPENELMRRRPVTLRGLLTHTAGLTVHGFPGYPASSALPSVPDILDGARGANTAPVRVDVEPGTLWRYSGGGYTVLQLLLSDVTGRPFPDLMRELVLEPAGMSASTYEQPLPAPRGAEAASGHRSGGKSIDGDFHVYPELAAAGLWTTASDLARFAIEIQNAYAGSSGRVVSRSMARRMLTPTSNQWGLGPSLEGGERDLRFGHGGSNEGFRCQLKAEVGGRRRGVVVMTNSDDGGAIIEEILESLASKYGWKD